MGTYANIFIEYKRKGKWYLINPEYNGKKVNSFYKQGILRDIFGGILHRNKPCIREFPEDMSEELKEFFKKEDPKENGGWNLSHVYLKDLYDCAQKKIDDLQKDIEKYKTEGKLDFINRKLNLVADCLCSEKDCYKETLQAMKELPEEDCEWIDEIKEEISEYQYLQELCSNIGFLVEFLIDDIYICEEDYDNIRLVGFCC